MIDSSLWRVPATGAVTGVEAPVIEPTFGVTFEPVRAGAPAVPEPRAGPPPAPVGPAPPIASWLRRAGGHGQPHADGENAAEDRDYGDHDLSI